MAVTLDDGYLDNFTTASPILTAAGVPATFFVTGEQLAGGADRDFEYWWDTLERDLKQASELPSELTLTVDGARGAWPTRTEREREAALYGAHALMLPLAPVARRRACSHSPPSAPAVGCLPRPTPGP